MNKKNTQQLSAPSMTVLLAASLAFAATTQAAVQTEGFYRLGEDDSGASNGGTVGTSLEHLNANGQTAAGGDLTPPGTAPTYTTDTPLPSSDFAIDPTNGDFSNDGNLLTTANFLNVTGDDFGLEGWFKFPASQVDSGGLLDEAGEILSFGTTGNGFGIGSFGSLGSNEVRGFIGGSGTTAPATITGDTWTHLAFVMDGGQAKFYQDGTQIGSAITGTPSSGTGDLRIGDLNALSDEVRVFTFSSGQFNASNDLLLDDASLQSQVIPEPQTYGLLLGAGVLLVSLARRRSHRS